MDFDALQASSRHGTRARYKAGCRCGACREANAAYFRDLRARRRGEFGRLASPDEGYGTDEEWEDAEPSWEEDEEPASLAGLAVLGLAVVGFVVLVVRAKLGRPVAGVPRSVALPRTARRVSE